MLDRMFMGAAADDKLFVEDVFSTYLYTGNGSTQTITNGIDLAGKGGLVWMKTRGANGQSNTLYDTVRGVGNALWTNSTIATVNLPTGLTSFNSTGFSLGSQSQTNLNNDNMASWTFREAPKFFDVVTFNVPVGGTTTFNHSLGSIPGCVIIKSTSTSDNWSVVHRGANGISQLNSTAANTGTSFPGIGTSGAWMNCTATTFNVSNFISEGQSYVAYLFAHDATSDGVIQCGSFTTDGSGKATVDLGWEPQWILYKPTNAAQRWILADNMRGMPAAGGASAFLNGLYPNAADAEDSGENRVVQPNATGFTTSTFQSTTNIYIAIRRGPMRTPTLGTSVYFSETTSAGGDLRWPTDVPDLIISSNRTSAANWQFADRLRGLSKQFASFNNNQVTTNPWLSSSNTNAEVTTNCEIGVYSNPYGGDQYFMGIGPKSASLYSGWFFKRAPGFMDVVCYTGNGVNGRTINHNLGVTPELMIMKNRSSAGYNWFTWDKSADLSQANALLALSNAAGRPAFSSGNLNSTVPTPTVFTIGGDSNASGNNYVTYLFASAAGVSKVGSYTGNGSSQTINCGFAAGARFVMIKRTDATGDWWVYDTARGIASGLDPGLRLNSTAAESSGSDDVNPNSTGFTVIQSTNNMNVSGATYIYLAIA